MTLFHFENDINVIISIYIFKSSLLIQKSDIDTDKICDFCIKIHCIIIVISLILNIFGSFYFFFQNSFYWLILI